ncbi:hypothetical protein CC80DRAFT_477546 [Byssothecium circinans]|uniref:RRM domain-containing protein n=1 Tax=Byssothecium circinans TaxID=147558 RepID=A0A6A5TL79_9PLEO|nr:hypothetical protein CC80DRAFT_477546 [Byssothecium circinans]
MAEVSLADFVNAQREKKKREALAQQFLGSQARKANASGAGAINTRKQDQRPSLLSRMSGVQKQRSSSARPVANIDAKWQHDLHRVNNPNGPPPAKKLNRTASTPQLARNARTQEKFAEVFSNRNAHSLRDNSSGPGFSIKGSANRGPYTIVASNFAPGTTGNDIEEVMTPYGDGSLLAARIISSQPTVMAEIDFDSKDSADHVIAAFNNMKADGRLLYVHHKTGPNASSLHSRPPINPRPSQVTQQFSHDDMDVDTNSGARNGGGGSFQDGRFGFSSSGRREPPRGPRRRF